MNKKAQELGLKNTNFKNPHGLDAAEHYSSAYDMAMIARNTTADMNVIALIVCSTPTFLHSIKPNNSVGFKLGRPSSFFL